MRMIFDSHHARLAGVCMCTMVVYTTEEALNMILGEDFDSEMRMGSRKIILLSALT